MAGDEDDIGIPAGADAAGSTGVPGAFATTDAEGSDGSEAGVATALADAVVEGAASCGCLEQAASANNDAIDRSKGTDFMADLSKSGRDCNEALGRRAISIGKEAGDILELDAIFIRDVLNCGLNGETL